MKYERKNDKYWFAGSFYEELRTTVVTSMLRNKSTRVPMLVCHGHSKVLQYAYRKSPADDNNADNNGQLRPIFFFEKQNN